ncbi:MAG: hypothetical protein AB8B87_03080 [Granulosicoccus sp.]
MFARFARCLLCLSLTGIGFSGNVVASSADDYLPGFAITLQHETVSDKVSYSPNLQAGGFAEPIEKPRFQSHAFSLTYRPDPRLRYHFSLAQRQMNSLRDAFVINELSGGVKRRFHLSQASRYSLDIGFDASVNHASEIYKNSYTSYANQLITEVRLLEPRDVRLSVSADLAMSLTDRLKMNLAVSGGMSQTSQNEVVGSARLDNDCRYAFNASTQGGSVRQLERCGDLISFEQHYPSDQTLNDRLGFSVADDLTYRDYFFGPQVSLHWLQGPWSIGAGYEFRQYFRPTLDHRIRQSGETPVSRSHSAFAGASIDVLRHWQVDVRVRYQQAAFLDDIPFLYNALTHERYRGNGVIRYALKVTRFFD